MSSVRPSFSCKGTRGKMRSRGTHPTVSPKKWGRLQSILGQDVPGAHQASPSASGLCCPWLGPLCLLAECTPYLQRSTFCSIPFYRVTQMPAVSFTVQFLVP